MPFTPEPATPRRRTQAKVEYPTGVTYFRHEIPGAYISDRNVSAHTRIHVAGMGYMSVGTAKALSSSLTAAVRDAEREDTERALAAQAAETENAG
jgi:hypothetical protein